MTMIDLSDVSLADLKAKYISNGYRSVVYLYDKMTKHGYMHCFMFDKNNQPFNFTYKYKCRLGYVTHSNTGNVDIYGRNIVYKEFNSNSERNKWIDSNSDIVTIVDCVSPAQDFLTKLFSSDTEDDDFNKQTLRIHTVDIENEISDTFEYPTTARNRINMITVYDSADVTFRTWSLQKVSKNVVINDGHHVVYDSFKTEAAMLKDYVTWHSNNYPDIITGWNIRSYDMPYVVRRIENILGEEWANKLSPVGQYRIKEIDDLENPNNEYSQQIEVSITGISQLDELLLYRDKFCIKAALSGGYNLSNVGQAEGLGDKVKFDGSLRDLYLHDWDKFYTYNVQDVNLVCDIENKYKLIPLSRQIVGFGLNANYEQIYGSIAYIIGSLSIFAKNHCNNVIFPTYSANKDIVNSSFEGAYVFDCRAGIYTGGIAAIDMASLYPNSIRAANISPETYIGIVDEKTLYADNTDIVIKTRDNTIKTMSKAAFETLLQNKCIFTKNNTLFTKPSVKMGILPMWCEHYYKIRILAKRGTVLEANKGNTALSDLLQAKNISLKLLLNSVYGIIGSKYCPFFNPDIAQSITRQGRFVNTESAKFVRGVFQKRYNIPPEYVVVTTGDTDSLFLNIKCITDDFKQKYDLPVKIKDWSDEYKLKLWHHIEKFVTAEVIPNIRKLLQTECHCEDTSMMSYELEYIGDVGIYEAKKHYGVHKIVTEGPKLGSSTKYVGLALRQATVPEAIKDTLKDVYNNTFEQNWVEQDFRNYMFAAYDKFVQLSVDDIALWKGYATAKASVGFLQIEKGATGIAKACQYYNDLIKTVACKRHHDEITLNSKVRFVYLVSNNIYNIKCIAFNDGDWPAEFNDLFQIDYTTMFDKCVLSPLKKFMIAAKYESININQQMLYDIFDI